MLSAKNSLNVAYRLPIDKPKYFYVLVYTIIISQSMVDILKTSIKCFCRLDLVNRSKALNCLTIPFAMHFATDKTGSLFLGKNKWLGIIVWISTQIVL